MPYSFKKSKYDPNAKPSTKTEIPPAGSIVAVEVLSKESVQEHEWAGTVEKKSKAGRPMIQVHVKVLPEWEGEGSWIIDYIILDTEYTDQKIGSMLAGLGFDMSDGISGYSVSSELICGRVGYVRIKHEEYNGEPRAKIAYWISPSQYERHNLDKIEQEAKSIPRNEPIDHNGDEIDDLDF